MQRVACETEAPLWVWTRGESLLVLVFPEQCAFGTGFGKTNLQLGHGKKSGKVSTVVTLKVIPPSFVFTGMLLMGTKSCTPSMTQGKNHSQKKRSSRWVLILKRSRRPASISWINGRRGLLGGVQFKHTLIPCSNIELLPLRQILSQTEKRAQRESIQMTFCILSSQEQLKLSDHTKSKDSFSPCSYEE